jgi:phosphotransferase family enzyme/methyltransferase family protein
MKIGGLLDQFPLHIFIRSNDKPVIVVIDSPELGRLNLRPMSSKCSRIIALSCDRTLLEQTREDMATGERVQLIQADEKMLPFRDQSVDVLITNSTSKANEGPQAASTEPPNAASEDVNRVLSATGVFVALGRALNSRATSSQKQEAHWVQTNTYYARRASGGHYFVTHDWLPSPWPFGAVHHGRMRSILIAIDLLLNRAGLRSLYGGISFAIHSNSTKPALAQRWTEAAQNNDGYTDGRLFHVGSDVYVKAGENALILGPNNAGGIAKLPFTIIGLEYMKNHLASINDLHASKNPRVASFLPQILDYGLSNGQAYWVESWIDGIPATSYSWRAAWKRKVAESALHFLIDLHQSTSKPTEIHRELFDDLLQAPVAGVEETIREFEPGFELKPLVEALWRVFGGRQIPLVRTHGDFWPGNILVSTEGQLSGVLDWGLSMKQGWPMLDLLHLIAFQHKWRATWLFGSVTTKTLMRRRLTAWEHKMVAAYCAALSLEDSLWPAFVSLYWLHHASQARNDFGEQWLRRNVIKPLPRILKVLSRCQDIAMIKLDGEVLQGT